MKPGRGEALGKKKGYEWSRRGLHVVMIRVSVATSQVTDKTATVLLRWARKYEIPRAREEVERWTAKQPVTVAEDVRSPFAFWVHSRISPQKVRSAESERCS